MLALQGVDAGYDSSQVLFGMSLEVAAHEVVSLIGRNGMGKSTAVRAILGLLPARGGRITLDGRDLAGLAPNRIARMGIGLVPEGRRIFGSLSVEENLLATARPPSTNARGWSIERVHALFPRLRERRAQSARTLSGGEQQMLAIGRCLMGAPRMIMFDEPSLGLSPALVGEVFETIRQLHAQGMTILLVEQNVAASLRLADRAYVLENGGIVLEGSGAALLDDPRVKEAYLGL